jgi:malonyl-CoA O-methyltransferase
MPSSNLLPDVQQVAQAFSQAAATYDQVAGLQRIAADQLLKKGALFHLGKVLDVGSGTGYVSAQLADVAAVTAVTGLDIAEGMLTYAHSCHHNSKLNWHLGDAQQLPLTLLDSAKGYDLVVSSLAIQWCKNLDAVFSGVAHCLSENGVFHCATLGPQTLHQLKWAWSQVDDYQHVNEFVALDTLRSALENHFLEVDIECELIELKYLSVHQLTKDLKQLGASNRNAHAAQGLMGVGRLRKMVKAYENLRDDQGQLPVTYEVYYITAKTQIGTTKASTIGA